MWLFVTEGLSWINREKAIVKPSPAYDSKKKIRISLYKSNVNNILYFTKLHFHLPASFSLKKPNTQPSPCTKTNQTRKQQPKKNLFLIPVDFHVCFILPYSGNHSKTSY